ncbi:MAG: C9orf72-like protein family-domain-containing protein [Linnemannia elongata]|nr:MAG: C9orf72-like protein family-domain-containing protein [Linnemannia elongata]
MSGHGEDAPGPPPTPASAHAHATTTPSAIPAQTNNNNTTPLIDHARTLAPTPDSLPEHVPNSSHTITSTQGGTKDKAPQESPPTTTTATTTVTAIATAPAPTAGPTPMDNHSPRSVSASNSTSSNLGSASVLNSRISSPQPPISLSPGYFSQVPTQSTTQLQLQVNTKSCSTSPPTLNLVPATPGPTSANSKPLTTDLPTSNPSTLSKHKGQPVLPYLVTPKEEKSHGAIWGLWDHDDGIPSKSITKVTKSSKGPPSTSGSSKVVTSMGAEAGRKALLALQSVAAEEGAPISIGAPRKKASAQQLASKFTILAPPLSSTLSVASAPVSPHKDRTIEALVTGISPGTPYESVSLPATPTATENRSTCLPENGFFLAVMSVYWSNLVGPRIEQIWTPRVGCPDESTLNQLAKQILNGEVMRTTETVESKMVVLQEEGLIAMSYLYTANPSMAETCSFSSTTLGITTGTLAMSTKFVLSFVVPLAYLQNFSGFFGVMSDHAPVLIEILRGLRSGLRLNVALDLFAEEHLVPFVEDVMTMEAVAMAIEGAKVSHIALGREGDQVFGREFLNRAITSHLQTNSSTVVVGNNITIMNMMINTLALFLSAEDRAKSCHARKQHRYLPDLFLQGIYTPSIGKESNTSGTTIDAETGLPLRKSDRCNRLYHILSSPFPTTIVDTVRCKVEQTERFPKYTALRSEYRREQTKCVIDRSISRVAAWNASNQVGYLNLSSIPPQTFQKNTGSDAGGFWGAKRENSWTSVEWKGQKVVRPVQFAAPMVENLVRCTVGLPIEMREGYVRQWRRGLVKRSMSLVKFVRKEGVDLAEHLEQQQRNPKQKSTSTDQDSALEEDPSQQTVQSAQEIFQQLGIDSSDLSIILGTAERILPSITEFVRVHLGVE